MRQGTSRIQPWLSVGLVLAALLCCGAAWAGQVNAVGLEQGATGTRAEIQLQGAGQYRTLSLTAPHRLVVDLPDSQAARGMRLPAPAGVWVALEGIKDPGNLGTIVRTVDSVGAAGVILLGEVTDPFALEAVRATMGSLFHVPSSMSLTAFL